MLRNLSWSNLYAEYAGFTPDPSNLLLDPLFCGIATANYAVRNTSPAAPTGPHGQIGAFGVGCNASTVDAPTLRAATLALSPPSPNPARGAFAIRFALPDAGPARLALYDIAGRLRWSRDVGAFGAGEHRIDLTAGGDWPPGIYLLRLRSGSRHLTARLALLD